MTAKRTLRRAVLARASAIAALVSLLASSAVQVQAARPEPPVQSLAVGQQARPPKPALVSNGGKLHSFSDAVYAPLFSDSDYGAFVDPQVQGDDRRLAIKFLKLMPINKRGDFTYVDGLRVLSNRVDVARGLQFVAKGDRRLPRTVSVPVRSPQPFAYPPSGGSGGPYLRHYSVQGVNAALGYASVPCSSNLAYLDNGFMYFNAYSVNSSGSVVDAGLAVDSTLQAHAFINSPTTGGYIFSGWSPDLNDR